MFKGMMRSASFAVFLAAAFLAPGGIAEAQADAKVIFIQGNPKVMKAGTEEWVDCAVDMSVTDGDNLQTASDEAVEIAFTADNANMIRIGGNTTVAINKATPPYAIELPKGNIVSLIRRLPKDSTFEIKTPACIGGARGTGWSTECTGLRASFDVFEGNIYTKGIEVSGEEMKEEVSVDASWRMTVYKYERPMRLEKMAEGDYKKWNDWKEASKERIGKFKEEGAADAAAATATTSSAAAGTKGIKEESAAEEGKKGEGKDKKKDKEDEDKDDKDKKKDDDNGDDNGDKGGGGNGGSGGGKGDSGGSSSSTDYSKYTGPMRASSEVEKQPGGKGSESREDAGGKRGDEEREIKVNPDSPRFIMRAEEVPMKGGPAETVYKEPPSDIGSRERGLEGAVRDIARDGPEDIGGIREIARDETVRKTPSESIRERLESDRGPIKGETAGENFSRRMMEIDEYVREKQEVRQEQQEHKIEQQERAAEKRGQQMEDREEHKRDISSGSTIDSRADGDLIYSKARAKKVPVKQKGTAIAPKKKK
jgi:hypothetical protein